MKSFLQKLQDRIDSYKERYLESSPRSMILKLLFWSMRELFRNHRSKSSFTDHQFHILIIPLGGIGDFAFLAKYIHCLKNTFGENIAIDISVNEQLEREVAEALFDHSRHIHQIIKYDGQLSYDCAIAICRYPMIRYLDQERLHKVGSAALKHYIDTVRDFMIKNSQLYESDYLGRCYTKLEGDTRENQADIQHLLGMSQTDRFFIPAPENYQEILEAIKTVYAPCFIQLIHIAQSGVIGKITDITASFTKLITDKTQREYDETYGGSVLELASYPLCVIVKLLGTHYQDIQFTSVYDQQTGVDIYTKIHLFYEEAMATANVGIGVKREGDLVIAGTRGYIYVPAPGGKRNILKSGLKTCPRPKRCLPNSAGTVYGMNWLNSPRPFTSKMLTICSLRKNRPVWRRSSKNSAYRKPNRAVDRAFGRGAEWDGRALDERDRVTNRGR